MPRRSTEKDFWKHVAIGGQDECWPWTAGLDDHGYGRVRYHQKEWKAHRLSWFLTFGDDPGELNICHKCDNPPCCNPAHFFRGTDADNMHDCAVKGRHPRNKTEYLPSGDRHHSRLRPEVMARGEKNGSAVLTAEKVLEIRARRARGESLRALARAYGVSKGTITFIVQRQTWKHI